MSVGLTLLNSCGMTSISFLACQTIHWGFPLFLILASQMNSQIAQDWKMDGSIIPLQHSFFGCHLGIVWDCVGPETLLLLAGVLLLHILTCMILCMVTCGKNANPNSKTC